MVFFQVTKALKRWTPAFVGILETEAVNKARTVVESTSRKVRRRADTHGPFETKDNEEPKVLSNHPLFNNPFFQPDETTELQDTNEAVRRAIDNVVRKYPQAKEYFDKLASDDNVTKKEAAIAIGRDQSMTRRYQRELKSALVREGIVSEPFNKPTQKRSPKKS